MNIIIFISSFSEMLSRYGYRFAEKEGASYYGNNPSVSGYNIASAPLYNTRFGVYVPWAGVFWNAGGDVQMWSSLQDTEYGGLLHAAIDKVYPSSQWNAWHGFSLRQ